LLRSSACGKSPRLIAASQSPLMSPQELLAW
jgi:hypothetical protein